MTKLAPRGRTLTVMNSWIVWRWFLENHPRAERSRVTWDPLTSRVAPKQKLPIIGRVWRQTPSEARKWPLLRPKASSSGVLTSFTWFDRTKNSHFQREELFFFFFWRRRCLVCDVSQRASRFRPRRSSRAIITPQTWASGAEAYCHGRDLSASRRGRSIKGFVAATEKICSLTIEGDPLEKVLNYYIISAAGESFSGMWKRTKDASLRLRTSIWTVVARNE